MGTDLSRDQPDHRNEWFIARGVLAPGMRTLHGTHVDGFPSLLALPGESHLERAHNYVETSDAIAAVVAHAEEIGAATVEAGRSDVDAWLQQIQGQQGSVIGSPDCTPGYYNNEGKPLEGDQQHNGGAYIEGPVAYFEFLEQWWKSGEFADSTSRKTAPLEQRGEMTLHSTEFVSQNMNEMSTCRHMSRTPGSLNCGHYFAEFVEESNGFKSNSRFDGRRPQRRNPSASAVELAGRPSRDLCSFCTGRPNREQQCTYLVAQCATTTQN